MFFCSENPAKPLRDIIDRVKMRDVDFMVEGNNQVLFSVGADVGDVKKLGPLRYDMMYELKYLLAFPIIDSTQSHLLLEACALSNTTLLLMSLAFPSYDRYTINSVIAEGPRDALVQLQSCQLYEKSHLKRPTVDERP